MFENLNGNERMKAFVPYIEEIIKNKKSTVVLEVYHSDDFWNEKFAVEQTFYEVNSACRTWIVDEHPHYPHNHAIGLIQNKFDYVCTSILLRSIKSIKVIKEE